MALTYAPEYTQILSLVRNPKTVFPVVMANMEKKLKHLTNIENKNWDNYGKCFLELYFWDDYMSQVVDIFQEIKSISNGNAQFIRNKLENWREQISCKSGIYEGFLAYYKAETPSSKKEYQNILVVLNEMKKHLNITPSKVFENRLNRFRRNEIFQNNNELIAKVFDIRSQCEKDNYFVVDSLAILNTFAKGRIKEAKEVSASFGLKEKYALLLSEENVDAVMTYCTNREFRKKVYIRNFEVKTQSKWSCEDEIKEIIISNYKESKDMGFSSVCRQISSEGNISYSAINQFIKNIQVEKFSAYSKWIQTLDNYAKNNLDINIIRAWDKKFVYNSYNHHLLDNCSWTKFQISTSAVWENTFKLIKRTFGIEIKELDNEKIYVNDKVLEFSRNKKKIGVVYISTEARNKVPVTYFIRATNASVWGESKIPLGVISFHLNKGGLFGDVGKIKDLLHELGHAIQMFISLTNPKASCDFKDVPFNEGLEPLAVEFPSQWLDHLALTTDFLMGVLSDHNGLMSNEVIQEFLDYWKIGEEEDDWENIYFAKTDWVIHRNKNCIEGLDEKIQELKKEFGFFTSKKDKALTDYRHFHMKGTFFGYELTKSMVSVFNKKFEHLTLEEKGSLLISWFENGAFDGILNKFDDYYKQPELLVA